MNYPIILVIGRRGRGKSLYATKLALADYLNGREIVANYKLKGIPYTYMTLKEISKLPPELQGKTVVIDEIQKGVDAREFWKQKNMDFSDLFLQLRKREIVLIGTTQVFSNVDKRLRDQVDYLITMDVDNIDDPTYFYATTYDINDLLQPIKSNVFIGKPLYDLYETKEIIQFGDENETETA